MSTSAVSGWSEQDLERVPRCPVCASPNRKPLHQGLSDVTFGTAGSGWRLWACASCASAYLDPRPATHAIHRAYTDYYTHQVPDRQSGQGDVRPQDAGLFRSWVDGYKHARFGSKAHQAHRFGALAVACLRPVRLKYERDYRHLPRPRFGQPRLLDVGCGDGRFLAQARDCGWSVCGIEPDPVAAKQVAGLGIRVICAGVEALDDAGSGWDVITMSHVIEHVPDPRQCLRQCLQALAPGGIIWVETPNIQSQGHQHFGADWRGLEVPRHLSLFNAGSLASVLEAAGFVDIRELPRPSAIRPLFKDSLRIRERLRPDQIRRLRPAERVRILGMDLAQWLKPATREVLTFSARRPDPLPPSPSQ